MTTTARPGWRRSTSAVTLLLANAVPLVGVLAFQWSVFSIMLLYWWESVTVGAFSVLRMLCARPPDGAGWIAKTVLIPFFIMHYGLFTLVYGGLVLALFSGGSSVRLLDTTAPRAGLSYAVVLLVVSHGVSFVYNYLAGGEYRRVRLGQLMMQPYTRVFLMGVTGLVGGILAQVFGSSLPAFVMLVVLKTATDLHAHVAEHRNLGGDPSAP